MKMKKLAAFLISATLIFQMAGCGKTEPSADNRAPVDRLAADEAAQ